MDHDPQVETGEGDLADLAQFVFDRRTEPGEVVLHGGATDELQPPDLSGALPMAPKNAPPAYKLFHVMYELFLFGVKLHNGMPLDRSLPPWDDMYTTTVPFVTRRMEMAFGVTPHLTPADAQLFANAPGRFHYKGDDGDASACSMVDTQLMLEISFTFGLPLGRRARRA